MDHNKYTSRTPSIHPVASHVTFYVGVPSRRVDIPLATALSSSNITSHILPDASSIVVRVPNADPATFTHYARFLIYHQGRDLNATNGPPGYPQENTLTWQDCRKYIALYMFGAQFQDKEYQNFVLQEISKWLKPSDALDVEMMYNVMQIAGPDEELLLFLLRRMVGAETGEHGTEKESTELDNGVPERGRVSWHRQQGTVRDDKVSQEMAKIPSVPHPGTKNKLSRGGKCRRNNIAQRQIFPAAESTWSPPASWMVVEDGPGSSSTARSPGTTEQPIDPTISIYLNKTLPKPPKHCRKALQPMLAKLKSTKHSRAPSHLTRASSPDDSTKKDSQHEPHTSKKGNLGRTILSAAGCGHRSRLNSPPKDSKTSKRQWRRSKSMSDLLELFPQSEFGPGERYIRADAGSPHLFSRVGRSTHLPPSLSLPSVLLPKGKRGRDGRHVLRRMPRRRAQSLK